MATEHNRFLHHNGNIFIKYLSKMVKIVPKRKNISSGWEKEENSLQISTRNYFPIYKYAENVSRYDVTFSESYKIAPRSLWSPW